MKKKIALSAFLAAFLLFSAITALASCKMNYLAGRQWLSGYTDDTGHPDEDVAGAGLTAMNAGAARSSQPQLAQPSAFSVAAGNSWHSLRVEAAGEFFSRSFSLKKDQFRPDDLATRRTSTASAAPAPGLIDPDPAGLKDAFEEDKKENTYGESPDISEILNAMPLNAFTETPDSFKETAESLANLEYLNGVQLDFFINELAVNGNENGKTVVVFARVDPLKYFSFSDETFEANPDKVEESAKKIATAASVSLPGRKVAAVIGYTNLTFYHTAPEIFGSEYTQYSPEEDGWRVRRFYSATLAQNGTLSAAWVDRIKG